MPDVWAAPFPLLTGREAGPGTGPGFRDEGFPHVQVIQVTIPPPGPTGLPCCVQQRHRFQFGAVLPQTIPHLISHRVTRGYRSQGVAGELYCLTTRVPSRVSTNGLKEGWKQFTYGRTIR